MSKLAIDIVLLPPLEITELAIELNSQLPEVPGQIKLSKYRCIPHISLCMGCLDEQKISEAEMILMGIASETPLLSLCMKGIEFQPHNGSEPTALLEIERSKQLMELHGKTMGAFEEILSCDAAVEMFADKEISQSSLNWVRDFPDKSAFENYHPHITIGYGRPSLENFPVNFRVDTLAICHLGEHCTCARIIAKSLFAT